VFYSKCFTMLLPAVLLWMAAPVCLVSARSDELLVSAAASLTDALTEIGKAYTKVHPETSVRFNFGASGALEQQIRQGAPVDVFVSASPKEMDALQQANRIETATRRNICGNRLVLIAPFRSSLRTWEDLRKATVRRVALSNPVSVPSGRYAQETLTRRGLWNAVQPKTVLGENVRQTLTYVMTGDVEAGLVFATDARVGGDKIKIIGQADPQRDHTPIMYPAAVVVGAPNAAFARNFVRFLQSPAAQSTLTRYGFASLKSASTGTKKR
jgi:molybdate transport system substrate-binding protein